MPDGDLELFPVGFGVYPGQEELDISGAISVEEETHRVAMALAPFGVRTTPWDVDMKLRGADATDERLTRWTESGARHSVLLWMGHGWSDGRRGALAHAFTPDRSWPRAITPEKLAGFIVERADPYDHEQWTLVVVEACDSQVFVRNLRGRVDELGANRLLLVGWSGATNIGVLGRALAFVLGDTFRAESEILLSRMVEALGATLVRAEVTSVRIEGAVLRRRTPVIVGTTVELAEEVERALAELSDDERQHFLPKARGGDGDNHTSYFQGRVVEFRRVADWLSATETGLLAVTGPPGSGKSALLGQLAVRSRPGLREALFRHGLLTAMPDVDGTVDDAFELSARLTGMTTAELIDDLAAGLGLGEPPPAPRDNRVAWLVARLRTKAPVTLMLDALDEAVDPLETAEALVRPIAMVEGVRVVVGTRRSTLEELDEPETADRNLLEALDPHDVVDVVDVVHDSAAVARYAAARLGDAVDPVDLVNIAGLISGSGRGFLFARLVVTEVLATPDWLRDNGLELLTGAGHRSVFAAAVDRLTAEDPAVLPLLRALALAQGRGVPIEDGIWGLIAAALSPGVRVSAQHIHRLIRTAAPYLLVDREHGQTVYRLAHRIFVEHFTAAVNEERAAHAAITQALIRLVRERPDEQLNPYVTNHLSAHAAEGGRECWTALADAEVITRLDLRTVASDATRAAFGRFPLPTALAATLTARHVLHIAGAGDQHGLFQLALARHADHPSGARGPGTWSVRWAALRRLAAHLTLTEHDRPVEAMTSFRTASGRPLLAVGSRDHVVQVWDPSTGQPFGRPIKGHAAPITALTSLSDDSGGVVLVAADSRGGVQLWDPMTGRQIGEPLSAQGPAVHSLTAWRDDEAGSMLATGDAAGVVLVHRLADRGVVRRFIAEGKAVRGLAVIGGRDPVLVAGDDNGMVRAWRLDGDEPVAGPVPGHRKGVRSLVAAAGGVITSANDGVVQLWAWTGEELARRTVAEVGRGVRAVAAVGGTLVAGDNIGWCHRFDITTGAPVGSPWQAHGGRVLTAAFASSAGDRCLLATGGEDGAVRLWEGEMLEPPPQPDTRTVEVVQRVADTVITGGVDGAVRRYDARTGAIVGDLHHRHLGKTTALAAWTGPDGVEWVASGGTDRVVRVRSASTSAEILESGVVRAVSGFTTVAGPTRLVTASGGDLAFRDASTGAELQRHQGAHSADIRALVVFTPGDGRALLASGGDDRMVRLWDAESGALEHTLDTMPGKVNAIAAVTTPRDGLLLAVATNEDTVRLWDPHTGREAGPPLQGHRGPVWAIAAARGLDGRPLLVTAGSDRMLREWDPSTGVVLRLADVALPMTSIAMLADGLVAVAGTEGVAVLSLDGGTPHR